MNVTLHKSRIKTIRQEDPDFQMIDGFAMIPRAGFHILPECPKSYRDVIMECINYGWLKPVAYVRDNELLWDHLSQ